MDCPKCGKRVIDIRKYKNGDRLYVHEAKLVLGGKLCEITKSCYVSKKINGR